MQIVLVFTHSMKVHTNKTPTQNSFLHVLPSPQTVKTSGKGNDARQPCNQDCLVPSTRYTTGVKVQDMYQWTNLDMTISGRISSKDFCGSLLTSKSPSIGMIYKSNNNISKTNIKLHVHVHVYIYFLFRFVFQQKTICYSRIWTNNTTYNKNRFYVALFTPEGYLSQSASNTITPGHWALNHS